MNDSEASIRLLSFATILVVVALGEILAPRRNDVSRRRWTANGLIVLIDTLLVRVVFPTGAVGAALWAADSGFGLFNQVAMPALAAAFSAYLLLDLAVYFQHRIFHAVPVLWRLHRVHHTDIGFDFTTALRFHPLEILLSMVIKVAIVIALGAPAAAVMAFEIVLNGTAVFNHANLAIPRGVDRLLRLLLVTPDMHRVHHSVHREETDSNFGFSIPWWDRLFGTYREQPRDGHRTMLLGIEDFREPAQQRLDRLLLQPFARSNR